jgi:3-hydroxymyristoyl/3-hydroxydecanoyl-(acyl carrier protein) dehydratase
LRLEAELVKLKARVSHVRGRVLVGEEVVAEGEIIASVVDLEGVNEHK